MNQTKLIIKTILTHPNCHIQYDDNGSWTIYKSKRAFNRVSNLEFDYEEAWEKITLIQGYDGDSDLGYAPNLTAALAKIQGLTIDSI